MSNIRIVPTVVPTSLEDVLAARTRYAPFANELHIDLADGVFAKNTTWMPEEGEKLLSSSEFSYAAHLMVAAPYDTGMTLIQAGVKTLIAHIEAFADEEDAKRAFEMWRSENVSLGVALLLDTPLERLDLLFESVDFVHLMSIKTIGAQGAAFDTGIYDRLQALSVAHPTPMLSVDGGVSRDTIQALRRAGAARFCVGSALAQSEHPEETYKELKALAESAI